MKKAFTMIELIFVIVILGILAAVIIPKLSATRDDADVSKIGSLIGTGIQEIADYVTSSGNVKDDFGEMSNAFSVLKNQNIASMDTKKATINVDDIDCLVVEVKSETVNGNVIENINITHNDTSDQKCSQLQSIVDPETYSIPISGINIRY
jgi:general secretion pathway protein G